LLTSEFVPQQVQRSYNHACWLRAECLRESCVSCDQTPSLTGDHPPPIVTGYSGSPHRQCVCL